MLLGLMWGATAPASSIRAFQEAIISLEGKTRSDTATLRILTSSYMPGLGLTQAVDLRVDNVRDLYSWGAFIYFDPTILQCQNVSEGTLVQEGDAVRSEVNNVSGIITYAHYLKTYPPVTGSGQLLRLTLESVGYGVSPITISPSSTLSTRPPGEHYIPYLIENDEIKVGLPSLYLPLVKKKSCQ